MEINVLNNFSKSKITTILCEDKLSNILNIDSTNIFYISEDYMNMFFNINIKEDIKYYLGNFNIELINELLDSFKMNKNILNKNYQELSKSEAKVILLIIALLIDKEIIIIENINTYLDEHKKQTIIKNLKKIKREDKAIIITSYNTNFILEITDEIIVIENNNIIKNKDKYKVLNNNKLLKKYNLEIPEILEYINKVEKLKNIKLGYRDNINDLIKDIYRYAK